MNSLIRSVLMMIGFSTGVHVISIPRLLSCTHDIFVAGRSGPVSHDTPSYHNQSFLIPMHLYAESSKKGFPHKKNLPKEYTGAS